MRRRSGLIHGVLGAVLAAGVLQVGWVRAARAQDAAEADSSQERQQARAARLTFAQGVVTVESADAAIGSQPAQQNLPLLAGVRVSTGEDGQAEVEFEDGSVVRLTPNSTLGLDTLAVDSAGVFTTGVSLLRGLAYAELRASTQYRYMLTVGGDVLSPVENTTVRVEFDEPPAKFAVIDGAAEITPKGGLGGREVRAGETLRASSDVAGNYTITTGIADESWDSWNTDRDNAEAAENGEATGVRDGYAGAQGYGWADLDANGTWYNVPGQGQVWQPMAAVEETGFDPYGAGAWMWYPGAGYVWASSYAWGWTPYRCGSWNYFNGFGWGWSPASGCGGLGWAFWGTGRPVNIGYGPSGYRVPVVPRPRPGPVHPILPTRLEPGRQPVALGGQTGWGTLVQRGPREIGGQIAIPVQRRGAEAGLRGSGVSGPSALARDYAVDRNSHVAVTGRGSTQPGLVHTEAGWQRAQERRDTPAAAQGYTGQSGADVFRQRREQGAAQGTAAGRIQVQPPASRPEAVAPGRGLNEGSPHSMQRPAYVPPAGQGGRPGEGDRGQRPMYSPPVQQQQMQRPSYTPPQQMQQMQRPSYTPPPQMQAPRYSPPPQMPHYSPPPAPPPAPAAAPAPAGRSPK